MLTESVSGMAMMEWRSKPEDCYIYGPQLMWREKTWWNVLMDSFLLFSRLNLLCLHSILPQIDLNACFISFISLSELPYFLFSLHFAALSHPLHWGWGSAGSCSGCGHWWQLGCWCRSWPIVSVGWPGCPSLESGYQALDVKTGGRTLYSLDNPQPMKINVVLMSVMLE